VTRAGAEDLARQRRQWQLVDLALRGVWLMAAHPASQPG